MSFEITYAVVRLTLRREKVELATGSAFIYRRSGQFYLVTAWHNVSGRHSESLVPLHSMKALPDDFIADMPLVAKNADGSWGYARIPVRFATDNGERTFYRVHTTQWPRVDVAVIPFDPLANHQHEVFLSTGDTLEYEAPLLHRNWDGTLGRMVYFDDGPLSVHFPDDISRDMVVQHTIGDDLFLLGFPAGVLDYTLTPIWKRATIATEPCLGWHRQPRFLVDSASRKGMSGGIALYFSKHGVVPVEPASYLSLGVPLYIVHGVYVGRIGDSEFEAQVGVVWKKIVIDEIIDGGMDAISTHNIELPLCDIRQVIRSEYANGTDHAKYIDEKPALAYFTDRIMEKVGGRANPLVVREEIKRVAEQFTKGVGSNSNSQ